MDDRPVGLERLEVIDSGSSERLYSAMRDQAERGRDFQRRVRWMWLRRDLVVAPDDALMTSDDDALLMASDDDVIDLRDDLPLISTEALPESRQEDSA
jgi:hypothetical protein